MYNMMLMLQAKPCFYYGGKTVQTFKTYLCSKQVVSYFICEQTGLQFSSLACTESKLLDMKHLIHHTFRSVTSHFWTYSSSFSLSSRELSKVKILETVSNFRALQKLHIHVDAHSETSTPPLKTIMEKLVNKAPVSVQPYLKLGRLDKPIGAWLLLWPCYWSLGLAAPPGHLPEFSLLAIFGIGALTMRAAGCTINDLWDKRIDKQVVRTKSRPLASGHLTSRDAVVFLAGELGFALLLLLQLNWPTVLIGASSLLLVIIYPLMKRITYWPQVVLGLTFNWGSIMGWTAVHGSCNWGVVLPLYMAGISWTMIYDTIYAHQDKNDDLLINIKSTALKFGMHTHKWLTGFSGLMLTCLGAVGLASGQTWPYYCCVGTAGLHLAYQIKTLNIDDSSDCWEKFKFNQWIGLILCIGIFAGNLLKKNDVTGQKNADNSS